MARVVLVTGVSDSRPSALALVEKYQRSRMADRAFDLAWTHSQVVRRQIAQDEALHVVARDHHQGLAARVGLGHLRDVARRGGDEELPLALQRVRVGAVEERLAACVNRLPGVRSTYRWEGAVHEDSEVLLVIKTAEDRFEALRERVVALHPYELPELVAVKVAAGLAPYLRWVERESGPAESGAAIDAASVRSP